ncbi:MAG: DUF308 domain-containing protein [Bacteroidetes bacterium]|nr:DUF308 domain-containing protein [Bacteroidota bacterium]
MKKFDITRLLLIAGTFWLILGTFSLISPSVTYLVIVQYSGLALLLDGLLWLSLCFAADSDKGERNWRMIESSVDIAFSVFLLLDPIFALLIFPFVVIPWMAVKGLLKMISSIALSTHLHGWSGDFIAGLLLVMFSLFMPSAPFGINVSIGIIGLTLGLLYFYDFFRTPEHRHIPFKH